VPTSPVSGNLFPDDIWRLSLFYFIQLLESQLGQLEGRLERRERELLAAVEEGRSAARVERARLESLHAQELREKDEQLLRFKTELESLVTDLRTEAAVQQRVM
jgi:hypothetical protein